jgi:hypothetical protein
MDPFAPAPGQLDLWKSDVKPFESAPSAWTEGFREQRASDGPALESHPHPLSVFLADSDEDLYSGSDDENRFSESDGVGVVHPSVDVTANTSAPTLSPDTAQQLPSEDSELVALAPQREDDACSSANYSPISSISHPSHALSLSDDTDRASNASLSPVPLSLSLPVPVSHAAPFLRDPVTHDMAHAVLGSELIAETNLPQASDAPCSYYLSPPQNTEMDSDEETYSSPYQTARANHKESRQHIAPLSSRSQVLATPLTNRAHMNTSLTRTPTLNSYISPTLHRRPSTSSLNAARDPRDSLMLNDSGASEASGLDYYAQLDLSELSTLGDVLC